MGMTKRPIDRRFWEKVDRSSSDECWLWKGKPGPTGYGRMNIDGKSIGAHRVSYLLNNGEIPENYCVCHSCDTPMCVNPKHLFLGTQQDNMLDMNNKGHNFFRQGHKFTRGEKNGRSQLTEAEVAYIRINSKNVFAKELALLFHVAESTIHRAVRGANWKDISTPPLKRRPGRSKLSLEQVHEMCLKSESNTITELGREYGITPAGVRYSLRKYKSRR